MKSIPVSAEVLTAVLSACSIEPAPAVPAAPAQAPAAVAPAAPAGEMSKENLEKTIAAAKAAAQSAGKREQY